MTPAASAGPSGRARPPALILAQGAGALIINKPAGLPAHAGPRGGASVEDMFPALSRRARGPWLAHRLDTDTAGCLAIALTKTALIALQSAFAEGRAGKTYWAVTQGGPDGDAGEIANLLRKHNTPAGWRMEIHPEGQAAVTSWRVLARGAALSLLEMQPRTGRTHQIRVHCAALGCPILGDPVYGQDGGGLHLLARALALPLTPPLCATAPVPPHMRQALAALGISGGDAEGLPSRFDR